MLPFPVLSLTFCKARERRLEIITHRRALWVDLALVLPDEASPVACAHASRLDPLCELFVLLDRPLQPASGHFLRMRGMCWDTAAEYEL